MMLLLPDKKLRRNLKSFNILNLYKIKKQIERLLTSIINNFNLNTMESNKEVISDLNSLVTILNDGKQGYESAAETTDSLELKAVFGKYALERAAYAAELKAHIKQHGGNEDDNDNGGLLGAVHRTWIDVKQAFAGNDNKAILDAILTGEKSAIEKYDGYIADYTDHADHLALLQKQRDGIQTDLKQIEALKLQNS